MPNLVLPVDIEIRPIGRYGEMHRKYLMKSKRAVYASLLINCKFHSYLADINEQAQDMLNLLAKQMAEAQRVSEQLKATNQMRWVGLMNNIHHCAEGIVLKELVYQ